MRTFDAGSLVSLPCGYTCLHPSAPLVLGCQYAGSEGHSCVSQLCRRRGRTGASISTTTLSEQLHTQSLSEAGQARVPPRARAT